MTWLGKSIEQTFNDYLQNEFRNAITRFAADGEDPLIISNYFESAKVGEALFLARYCARRILERAGIVVREMKAAIHGDSIPSFSSKTAIGD